MNAVELYKQDGTPTGIYACGVCNSIWLPKGDKARAEACCVPRQCSLCGEALPAEHDYRYRTAHMECQQAKWKKENEERLERAEKVAHWDGWVFTDALSQNDGFFESAEALREALEDSDIPVPDWPEYAYCTKTHPFPGLSVERLLEDSVEEAYEDAYDNLRGTEELAAAVKAFNAANEHIVTYIPDYTRAVALFPREM